MEIGNKLNYTRDNFCDNFDYKRNTFIFNEKKQNGNIYQIN